MSETLFTVLPQQVCDICKKEITFNQANVSLKYCDNVKWFFAHKECFEEMNKHSVQFERLL